MGRQQQFCSISCRNRSNGRRVGGWNKARIEIVCENCGIVFTVPPHRVKTARACSKPCVAALHSRERRGKVGLGDTNPIWKGGIQTYRQYRKDSCERCGSDIHLLVHHKDKNRYNNALDNLETLCRRCHAIHHDSARFLPQGPRGPRTRFPQACEWCGATFVRAAGHLTQKFCSRRCANRARATR